MKTKKLKFNIVDFLLLLMILLLVAGAVWKFTPNILNRTNSSNHTVTYKLEITDLLPEIELHIKDGATVYDVQTGVVLGTIQTHTTVPATYQQAGSSGEIQTLPHPEYVKVTLTISTVAKQTNPVTINGITLRIGTQFQLKTSDFIGTGTCTTLSVSAAA